MTDAILGAGIALTGVAIGTALAQMQARRRDLELFCILRPQIANTEPPTTAELEASA